MGSSKRGHLIINRWTKAQVLYAIRQTQNLGLGTRAQVRFWLFIHWLCDLEKSDDASEVDDLLLRRVAHLLILLRVQ